MYPDIFKKRDSELASTTPIATMIDAYFTMCTKGPPHCIYIIVKLKLLKQKVKS